MSVAQYMQAALYDPEGGYYRRAPGIGEDFITGPESSQMFGELIGLWCVHEWRAMGAPDPFNLIELGPGRGALIADALRAARLAPDFLAAMRLQLAEISPALRAAQKAALDAIGVEAIWLEDLPAPGTPSLFILNEFLDCFPIRQFVRTEEGWREKMVGLDDAYGLCFGLGPALPIAPGTEDRRLPSPIRGGGRGWGEPPKVQDGPANTRTSDEGATPHPLPPPLTGRGAPLLLADDEAVGAIREEATGLRGFIDQLAEHLLAAPSRALIIDYGGDGSGDTLQALRKHQKVDPLAAPGESDLTAHVDFRALALWAEGLRIDGPIGQGDFLRALGIEARAAALQRANPARGEQIGRELHRLTHPDSMGVLFKALCLSSPTLPPPAGF